MISQVQTVVAHTSVGHVAVQISVAHATVQNIEIDPVKAWASIPSVGSPI